MRISVDLPAPGGPGSCHGRTGCPQLRPGLAGPVGTSGIPAADTWPVTWEPPVLRMPGGMGGKEIDPGHSGWPCGFALARMPLLSGTYHNRLTRSLSPRRVRRGPGQPEYETTSELCDLCHGQHHDLISCPL